MNVHVVDFGVFSLSIPSNWSVLSSDGKGDGMPITMADHDGGVGALQISLGTYRHGALPKFVTETLIELIDSFAVSNKLGEGFDKKLYPSLNPTAGESFHSDGNFVRVWHVSDGKSIVLFSYVCEWKHRGLEAREREWVIQSCSFTVVNGVDSVT